MNPSLFKAIKCVMAIAFPFAACSEGLCSTPTFSNVVPLGTAVSFFSTHAIFGIIALVVIVLFIAFLTVDPKKKDKKKKNPHDPL